MEATVGRIVHYKLNAADVEAINRRRSDAGLRMAEIRADRLGYVAHVGNSATEGQVLPAMVVATWSAGCVNLQVLLDGVDTYWATSRTEGEGSGHWSWPPRV
jgi:hypothetical protein